jgi:hypothetical protein
VCGMSSIGRDQAVVNTGMEFLSLHIESGDLLHESKDSNLRTDAVSSSSPVPISETVTINVDYITIY